MLIRPRTQLWRLTVAAGLVLSAHGCGAGGLPGTVPISGRVLYRGEPLGVGTVLYIPVDTIRGRVARGKLDADGRFTLTTLKSGDGALPGEYRIAVIALAPHPGEPPPGAPSREIRRRHLIPERYADCGTSGLRDTVDGSHSGYHEIVLED